MGAFVKQEASHILQSLLMKNKQTWACAVCLKSSTILDSVSSGVVVHIHPMIQCDICKMWYIGTTVLEMCSMKMTLNTDGLGQKWRKLP